MTSIDRSTALGTGGDADPRPRPRGFTVGLTGGIGSGKSTVADHFVELGAALVDTDRIAHELTAAGGAAMPAITRAFGTSVVAADGSLDRTAMRGQAFGDPTARRQLEAILHPLIRERSDLDARTALAAGAPYVVLAIPLLVESGSGRSRFDRILVVDCPTEVQIARVMQRAGMTRPEVERILAAQATREARLAVADDVIDNGGDRTALPAQVATLHAAYLGLAARRSA
ncbi:MAG: dephospho-CoA kinase [Burkholderiaceae bacterium]